MEVDGLDTEGQHGQWSVPLRHTNMLQMRSYPGPYLGEAQWREAPLRKIIAPFLEKCVGHSLKVLSPFQKTLRRSGVPSWL